MTARPASLLCRICIKNIHKHKYTAYQGHNAGVERKECELRSHTPVSHHIEHSAKLGAWTVQENAEMQSELLIKQRKCSCREAIGGTSAKSRRAKFEATRPSFLRSQTLTDSGIAGAASKNTGKIFGIGKTAGGQLTLTKFARGDAVQRIQPIRERIQASRNVVRVRIKREAERCQSSENAHVANQIWDEQKDRHHCAGDFEWDYFSTATWFTPFL